MREGGRDLLILLLLLLIGDKAPKPPKYVLKMGDRRKWHNKWSLCQNFWWSYWQSFYCVLVWRVQACSLYHVSYIIDQSESSHSCCYSIGTNCIDFKNKILDKYSHYYPNFNCKYVLEIFVTHFVLFFFGINSWVDITLLSIKLSTCDAIILFWKILVAAAGTLLQKSLATFWLKKSSCQQRPKSIAFQCV